MSDEKVSRMAEYTPLYKEKCFEVWYTAGRPNGYVKVIDLLPEDEYGRKPSKNIFASWRDELGWDLRADDLDARASLITDDELVNNRVLMLKEQAARAKELQIMGLNFLREHDFDSSSSAVSAVIKGAELERVSKGLGEQLTKLLKMSDEELVGNVQKLLERASLADAPVISMEEIPEEEKEEEDDTE